MKSTIDRLTRWSWEISALPYKFVILPGTSNVIADFLLRWGVGGEGKPEKSKACISEVPSDSEYTYKEPGSFHSARSQAMLMWGHEPSTIYEIPHPFEWPNTNDIVKYQKSLTDKEILGAELCRDKLWHTPKASY